MNPIKPSSGVRQPASLLAVDDTPANLQVLAGMLKDRGYKVRPVPGGKLALLAARRAPPDLILLDINMPEMNGYEVCEQLKADDALKGIPVIFISALTEPLDRLSAAAISAPLCAAGLQISNQPSSLPVVRGKPMPARTPAASSA